MTGETAGRHPGEHAEGSAPPGWYADPYGAPEMRLWDGRRWTLEVRPWPIPGADEASPHGLFNWPALVATLAAAGFVASWVSGEGLVWFFAFLVMLFGGLGADEKYAGRHVALVLAVAGTCLFAVLLIMELWLALEEVVVPI